MSSALFLTGAFFFFLTWARCCVSTIKNIAHRDEKCVHSLFFHLLLLFLLCFIARPGVCIYIYIRLDDFVLELSLARGDKYEG